MKYHITDKSRNVMLSNLDSKCIECVQKCEGDSEKFFCAADGKQKRHGVRKVKDSQIYICSSHVDDLQSSKNFKKNYGPYIQLIHEYNNIRESIIEPVNASAKRLVHNVVDLNAKNSQDLEYYFSDVYTQKNYTDQVKYIKNKILELNRNKDNSEIAVLIWDIMKREKMIKFEIATHNKIVSPTSSFDKNKASHRLHKVFLNASYLFSKAFEDFGVEVVIQQSELEAYFDYQSLSVALTHLLNNAEKYSAENEKIQISFKTDKQFSIIVLDMISLKITDQDLLHIFDEGYSGEESKKAQLNGSGIGMWLAKWIINKNGGHMKVTNNFNKSLKKVINDRYYENNIFEIYLPTYRS